MADNLPRSIDGYPVVKELGRGVSGAVFQVRLPGKQKFAALKMFEGEVTAAEIIRFRREFGAIARCRHEGIVSVYGLGELDQRPYILMEYVKGQPLDEFFRTGLRANEPLPVTRQAQLLKAIHQVLDTLGYLHNQKIIHRDIKPANIFVTDDERVKLLDFGMAWQPTNIHSDRAGGTAGYQSPEQILGQPMDLRSDLYSLGITIYEIIAGIHPFGACTSWQTLLERQLNNRCNRLKIMNPAYGDSWDYYVGKLMAPDPVNRFFSAGQALVELGRLGEDLLSAISGSSVSITPSDILQTPWVGSRESIDEAVRVLMESPPRHVWFSVPPGGGRSRFLDEVIQQVQTQCLTFRVDCARESSESWLGRLIRRILPESVSLRSAEFMPVSDFLDPEHVIREEKPEKVQAQFLSSLKRLLKKNTRSSECVIAFDNCENLTEPGLQICLILADSGWIRLLMAGGSLPERLERKMHCVNWQKADLIHIRELIGRILGREEAAGEQLAAAITRMAEHKTGTVVHYFQNWLRSEQLIVREGAWTLMPPAVSRPVRLDSDEVADLVLRAPVPGRQLPEIDRLDREILRTISSCQTPCSFSLLTRLFAARDTLLLEVLDRLIRNGWLTENVENGEVVYQFKNIHEKSSVYKGMSPFHRRYMHRRIWETIRKQQGLNSLDVFTHASRSEDPQEGLREMETVAQSARDRFDNEHALNYYQDIGEIVERAVRDAADILPGPEDWVVRLENMSYSMLVEAARSARGMQLMELQKKKIDVHRNRGNIFGRTGDYGSAFDAFHHMLVTARDLNDRQSEGDALRFIGQILFYQRKLDESEKYFKESLEIRKKIPDEAGIADCLNGLGVLSQQKQQFDLAHDYFDRSLKLKQKLGDERGMVYVRNNIANLFYGEKKLENALDEFRESALIFRRLGDELGLAYCLYNIGGVCIELGQFQDAVSVLSESLAIRRKMQDLQDTGHCLWQLATALSELGRYQDAIECLTEAAALLEEVNLPEDAEECRLMRREFSDKLMSGPKE